jgi:hypothetical protein
MRVAKLSLRRQKYHSRRTPQILDQKLPLICIPPVQRRQLGMRLEDLILLPQSPRTPQTRRKLRRQSTTRYIIARKTE